MFTGLIDDVGTVESASPSEAGHVVRVGCGYDDLAPGESIALNGACLTVRECGAGWFTAAAVHATLSRTTIAEWGPGRRINLERAMRADSRFGGHIVQGHVDGLATVIEREVRGDTNYIDLALPLQVDELAVLHGSIAMDGVSLTVQDRPADGAIRLALIDYTLRHTNLDELSSGDRVHVEADIVGKYVQRLLDPIRGRVAGAASPE